MSVKYPLIYPRRSALRAFEPPVELEFLSDRRWTLGGAIFDSAEQMEPRRTMVGQAGLIGARSDS
jgi:hypothetical protein